MVRRVDVAARVQEVLGYADAVAFGQLYIANPDLVERLRINAPLNSLNTDTIYSNNGVGYNDYPTLEAEMHR